MADEVNWTEEALRDLQVVRAHLTDRGSEAQMSVNDWVGRIKTATGTAHQAARAAVTGEEYQAWLEVAAAALGRAETVLQAWAAEEAE